MTEDTEVEVEVTYGLTRSDIVLCLLYRNGPMFYGDISAKIRELKGDKQWMSDLSDVIASLVAWGLVRPRGRYMYALTEKGILAARRLGDACRLAEDTEARQR